MNIWEGSVTLPGDDGTTHELIDLSLSTHLLSPQPTNPVLNHLKRHLADSSLSFLKYIPPSSVPFYLAAGPSLHVASTNSSTSSFLRALFLSTLPTPTDSEEGTHEQSRLAILLRVSPQQEPQASPRKPVDWGVTEILIYGALTPQPTPPQATAPAPEITIYALPLSSRHSLTIPPVPIKPEPARDGLSDEVQATFITPDPQEIINPVISSAARKRRAEALDKAAEKKAKRSKNALGALAGNVVNERAREAGVSLARPSNVSPTPEPKFHRRPSSVVPLPPLKLHRRTSSIYDRDRERPMSAGSIHSAHSVQALSEQKPKIKKEPSTVSETEVKNKDLLNRTVLDEMKKRGMKDYRQRQKSMGLEAGMGVAVVDGEKGKRTEMEREEFKNVFHMTVKAACFAMRKKNGLWSGESVKEVVRGLLDVFGIVAVRKEGDGAGEDGESGGVQLRVKEECVDVERPGEQRRRSARVEEKGVDVECMPQQLVMAA